MLLTACEPLTPETNQTWLAAVAAAQYPISNDSPAQWKSSTGAAASSTEVDEATPNGTTDHIIETIVGEAQCFGMGNASPPYGALIHGYELQMNARELGGNAEVALGFDDGDDFSYDATASILTGSWANYKNAWAPNEIQGITFEPRGCVKLTALTAGNAQVTQLQGIAEYTAMPSSISFGSQSLNGAGTQVTTVINCTDASDDETQFYFDHSVSKISGVPQWSPYGYSPANSCTKTIVSTPNQVDAPRFRVKARGPDGVHYTQPTGYSGAIGLAPPHSFVLTYGQFNIPTVTFSPGEGSPLSSGYYAQSRVSVNDPWTDDFSSPRSSGFTWGNATPYYMRIRATATNKTSIYSTPFVLAVSYSWFEPTTYVPVGGHSSSADDGSDVDFDGYCDSVYVDNVTDNRIEYRLNGGTWTTGTLGTTSPFTFSSSGPYDTIEVRCAYTWEAGVVGGETTTLIKPPADFECHNEGGNARCNWSNVNGNTGYLIARKQNGLWYNANNPNTDATTALIGGVFTEFHIFTKSGVNMSVASPSDATP